MRLRAALSTFALAAAAVVAGATAASATTCPSGYSCTWEDSNFNTNGNTNARLQFASRIPHFSSFNYSGTAINSNNSASSMHNNGTTSTVYYYSNDNCGLTGGTSFSRPIGQQDGDFSNDTPLAGGAFNDVASSGAFSGQITNCVNAG